MGFKGDLEQGSSLQRLQDRAVLPALWYPAVFPRGCTGLQGLVKERSAVVRFKVKGEDAYFLAWTTTPWTLPSNIALCVNPEETYIKVKAADGYTYYLAEALADKVLGKLAEEGEKAYEVLETYKGKDLEYKEYEPLYAVCRRAG